MYAPACSAPAPLPKCGVRVSRTASMSFTVVCVCCSLAGAATPAAGAGPASGAAAGTSTAGAGAGAASGAPGAPAAAAPAAPGAGLVDGIGGGANMCEYHHPLHRLEGCPLASRDAVRAAFQTLYTQLCTLLARAVDYSPSKPSPSSGTRSPMLWAVPVGCRRPSCSTILGVRVCGCEPLTCFYDGPAWGYPLSVMNLHGVVTSCDPCVVIRVMSLRQLAAVAPVSRRRFSRPSPPRTRRRCRRSTGLPTCRRLLGWRGPSSGRGRWTWTPRTTSASWSSQGC